MGKRSDDDDNENNDNDNDNGNNDHNNNNNNDDNNDNTKINNNNNISNSNNNKVIRSSRYFKNMLVRCRPGRDAYVISSHDTVTTGESNDNMDGLDNTVVTMNENEKDEEKRELILRTV